MSRDTDRVVWLFGKPYWWEPGPYGQLALRHARWAEPEDTTRVRVLFNGNASEFGRQIGQAVRRARRHGI